MSAPLTNDQLSSSLTLKGALLVADSTALDVGDMKIIALKVLAHEYRKLRLERDGLINNINTMVLGA